MKHRHLPVLLCLLAACSGPRHSDAGENSLNPTANEPTVVNPEPTAVNPEPSASEPKSEYALQLEKNHNTWLEIGEGLRQTQRGKWVLLAGGQLHGTWFDFDSAWRVANGLPDEQLHAYLYRAGIDDVECTFYLSPFTNNNPRWNQLGIRIRRPWKLTIAAVADTWYRGDKKVSWGDSGARVQLSATPAALSEDSVDHSVRAVASNMFEYDLTLRQADVDQMGLGRFTAPTPAYYLDKKHPCAKVIVRVCIPELEIEAPAVAFVLPESETEKLVLQPPLPAKYGFQTGN